MQTSNASSLRCRCAIRQDNIFNCATYTIPLRYRKCDVSVSLRSRVSDVVCDLFVVMQCIQVCDVTTEQTILQWLRVICRIAKLSHSVTTKYNIDIFVLTLPCIVNYLSPSTGFFRHRIVSSKNSEIWNVTRDNYRDENRNNLARMKIHEQLYTNFRETSNAGKTAVSKSRMV